MYITTGDTEATSLVERARKLAQSTGGTYVPRNRTSLARMLERYGVNEILVVLKGRARLFRKDAPQLEFHPSMGNGFLCCCRQKWTCDCMRKLASPLRIVSGRHGAL